MQARTNVKAFDPINDVESSLGSGFVSEWMDPFGLQYLEQALRWRIVPAIGILICVKLRQGQSSLAVGNVTPILPRLRTYGLLGKGV
jgi:hypothetical protein